MFISADGVRELNPVSARSIAMEPARRVSRLYLYRLQVEEHSQGLVNMTSLLRAYT